MSTPCYLCAVPGKDARCETRICATCAEGLRERRDELLALVAKISKESISPDEAAEMTKQIAALIAEVGTLRAEVQQERTWREAAERKQNKTEVKMREYRNKLDKARNTCFGSCGL